MKLNQYISQSEIHEIIEKIVKLHQNKAFDVFDADDIGQQVRIICISKLNKFDISKVKNNNNIKQALENWLNTITSNSLKNFYRDNYGNKFKAHKDESEYEFFKRGNLASPLSIHKDEFDCDPEYYDKDMTGVSEDIVFIYDNLDDLYSEILDSVLAGDDVPGYYKTRLIREISKIMREYGRVI
jgi:hypothetical protein